jgi:predicted RecA/RadA family phage recombinase
MRNFIQAGNTVVVPAPYVLTSGQGAKVGQLFGVATNDAALSADVALDLTGVFELTKIGSQAWTVGALVYWDDANKRCTTVATANLLIGVAAAAVAGGAGNTTGRVRLNASFRANDP